MAVSAWTVMIRLNSSTTLPATFGKISKTARDAERDIKNLEHEVGTLSERVERSRASFGSFSAATSSAKQGVSDLGQAFTETATAARAASAASSSLAVSSFVSTGAAASRAAANVTKLATAIQLARTASGAGGGGRIPVAPYALPAPGLPPPSMPSMRNVTPMAMAGAGGGGRGGTPFYAAAAGGMPPPFAFRRGGGGLAGGGGVGGGLPPGGGPPGGGGGAGGGGGLGRFGGGFAAGALGGLGPVVKHAAIYGTGIGIAAGTDAIVSAAGMQTALISVKNATGASDRQIDRLRAQAFDIGDKTGMSATKAAEVIRVIAQSSGGVFTTKTGDFDIKGFMAIAPTIAEISRIQQITRGVDLNHAATTEIQLAHLFRSYSGASMNETGDLLTRLSEMMPDSLDVARNQFTYFLPLFKGLGISNKDSVATMALLDRMGYGRGKGGTNISDLLQASLGGLQLTKHSQAGKDALLRKIGVVDSNDNSKFFTDNKADLLGFLHQLNTFAMTHGRTETMKDFKSAFGIQGARIATLALDPGFVEQLSKIEGVMNNKNISLPEQLKRFDNSTGFQFSRALGNWQSLLTEIGWQALPGVTRGLRDLGDVAHSGQVWLHQHAGLEKQIQKSILDGVKGVEQYVSTHRKGLEDFRDDMIGLIGAAAKLGPQLSTVADGFGAVYTTLAPLVKFAGAVLGVIPQSNHNQRTADQLSGSGAMNRVSRNLHNPVGPHLPSPAPLGPNSASTRSLQSRMFGDGSYLTGARPTRTSAITNRHPQTVAVTINHHYQASPGETDATHRKRSKAAAREMAQQVAAILADHMPQDVRAGGTTPQLAGYSHHALLAGVPS